MNTRNSFTVRPFVYSDSRVIDDPRLWKLSRDGLLRGSFCIVAIAEDGTLAGYCTFDVEDRRVIRMSMLESRRPGAGSEMLNGLKARVVELIAEDVVTTSEAWWKRRGFTKRKTISREAGTVGHYGWRRSRDERFARAPLVPFWPDLRKTHRIVYEGIDQERLDEAIEHMVRQPNFLPVVTVPSAFVEAVQQAITAGQIAPEAVPALQEHLAKIAMVQAEPLRRTLVWYADAMVRLVELDAPAEVLEALQVMMREYVRQMEIQQRRAGGGGVAG